MSPWSKWGLLLLFNRPFHIALFLIVWCNTGYTQTHNESSVNSERKIENRTSEVGTSMVMVYPVQSYAMHGIMLEYASVKEKFHGRFSAMASYGAQFTTTDSTAYGAGLSYTYLINPESGFFFKGGIETFLYSKKVPYSQDNFYSSDLKQQEWHWYVKPLILAGYFYTFENNSVIELGLDSVPLGQVGSQNSQYYNKLRAWFIGRLGMGISF